MFIFSQNFLFYFLSGILVFSALVVVVAQHAVFSLLFLVLCFIFSSFLLFLLECEFLSLIFIVIYVGAIAVLFLFAIMMLNAKMQYLSRNLIKYFPTGLLFGIIFLIPLLYWIFTHFDQNKLFMYFYKNTNFNWYDLSDSITDLEEYGQILYSYFVLQFLVVGLILLVVLIGIVYLTNTYTNKHVIDQAVFKQLSTGSHFFSA